MPAPRYHGCVEVFSNYGWGPEAVCSRLSSFCVDGPSNVGVVPEMEPEAEGKRSISYQVRWYWWHDAFVMERKKLQEISSLPNCFVPLKGASQRPHACPPEP